MFIRVRKYYTRDELNLARNKHAWPPGCKVPEFGKYIEEGAAGTRPSPTGKVKFTASQTRHWLERGTLVMLEIFESKVRYMCVTCWLHGCHALHELLCHTEVDELR